MASQHDKVQVVLVAFSTAQKGVVGVQEALKQYNGLAVQIPMYERLGKMVAELRSMSIDAQRLPL